MKNYLNINNLEIYLYYFKFSINLFNIFDFEAQELIFLYPFSLGCPSSS